MLNFKPFRPFAVLAVLAFTGAFAGSAAKAADKPVVVIETSLGNITVELEADRAPKTVENFLKYVDKEFYNGTVFHRVMSNFMIQGGGMKPDLSEKPVRAPITLESGNGLNNLRGTVAMARTPAPNSATSQFFVNVVDNAFLDKANSRDGNGYAVFGKVVEGMDVVDKIKSVPVKNAGPFQNVPVTPVIIKKASLEK